MPIEIEVYVAAHERDEVVEVYADRLTEEQKRRILDNDHAWKIILCPDRPAKIEPIDL